MTATTSFQHGLLANESALAAHGVYLPKAARSRRSPRTVSHHHLGWELAGNPLYRQGIGGWDALRSELEAVEAETVLVSSELLGGLLPRPDEVDRMEERILALGRSVTILYVVREQLSLLNSMYAQEVKQLQSVPVFGDYATELVQRGEADVERLTARWRDSSRLEFVAVPFARIEHADPLTVLLGAAGIDIPPSELTVEPASPNASLGPVAIEAFRLLRAYLAALNPAFSADGVPVRRLCRVAVRYAREAGWCDEPHWGWRPELARRVAQQLAASNERFARAVWGSGWPMPLPVDEPQRRVHLMRLPPDELDSVHDFVGAMARRYVQLRSGTSAATEPAAE